MKTVLVGLVSAGAVIVGGGTAVAVLSGPPGPDKAQVVEVIDGDTVDVSYDGSTHRVRLLNIDTPETKDPNAPVECLGAEATAYLEQLLEPGDAVRLEFDVERLDQYDRELAGVYEGDTLINAEIARAGMGVPVIFEPNRKFYPEVVAAYEEAKAAGVGLFSASTECTLTAQVEGYAALVVALEGLESPEHAVSTAEELAEQGDSLIAVIAGAEAGSLVAAGLTGPELEALQLKVTDLHQRAQDAGDSAREEVERLKEEAEKKAAEEKAKEEAEKKAKEEAEKKAAEEKAKEEAEKKAKEEAEKKAAEEKAAAEAAREAAEQAERDRKAAQPQPQPQPVAPQPAPPAPAPPAPAPPAPQPPPTVPYYKNCDAARAAGAAPVYIGTPGYGKHLDRDGDGIGCE
ncbi:thermonuclease family protein [Ornithinimicrobium sufpigmenti]|uniref:thermonuclease family protein n=1 Tax=Ornithinimicrobium sufpigmenti TaxID=2508882 RepID=UPI0015E1749F|nr:MULTISPECIES: excalibur calcium-binding domain-containing protein [unclassified Ornithinimicrobium]